MKTSLKWNGKMSFDATFGNHVVKMDTSAQSGGDDSAPTPKQLVLAGVCGCTAMDVVYVLNKMRLPAESLTIDAEAETTEGHPAVFRHVHLIYRVKASALPVDKLRQAIELSQTKYCGVSAMIAKSARITYVAELNGERAFEGEARFP